MTFGRQLQNPITLVVSDGMHWTVEWALIDGSVWFTEGWVEFARNYNINAGDFLFFKVRISAQLILT